MTQSRLVGFEHAIDGALDLWIEARDRNLLDGLNHQRHQIVWLDIVLGGEVRRDRDDQAVADFPDPVNPRNRNEHAAPSTAY
jgi:hypothetical protein